LYFLISTIVYTFKHEIHSRKSTLISNAQTKMIQNIISSQSCIHTHSEYTIPVHQFEVAIGYSRCHSECTVLVVTASVGNDAYGNVTEVIYAT